MQTSLTLIKSFVLTLIYLTCMGGVLDDNANWLYDHPGVTSTDQSAIVAELAGLILSAIFTVSNHVMSGDHVMSMGIM